MEEKNFNCSQAINFLLTGLRIYIYGRIQSPRPDVEPDQRVNTALARLIRLCTGNVLKGTGNDKQRKDAGIEPFARINILVRQ